MSVSVIAPLAILVLSNISIWKAVRRSSANFNQSGYADIFTGVKFFNFVISSEVPTCNPS